MKAARSPGLAGFLAEVINTPAAVRPVKSAEQRAATRALWAAIHDPKNFKPST